MFGGSFGVFWGRFGGSLGDFVFGVFLKNCEARGGDKKDSSALTSQVRLSYVRAGLLILGFGNGSAGTAEIIAH